MAFLSVNRVEVLGPTEPTGGILPQESGICQLKTSADKEKRRMVGAHPPLSQEV